MIGRSDATPTGARMDINPIGIPKYLILVRVSKNLIEVPFCQLLRIDNLQGTDSSFPRRCQSIKTISYTKA